MDRPDLDPLRFPVDLEQHKCILRVGECALNFLLQSGFCSCLDGFGDLRHESGHHCEPGQLVRGHLLSGSIAPKLISLGVNDDHFTIHSFEGANAEIAMGKKLRDRY